MVLYMNVDALPSMEQFSSAADPIQKVLFFCRYVRLFSSDFLSFLSKNVFFVSTKSFEALQKSAVWTMWVCALYAPVEKKNEREKKKDADVVNLAQKFES